MYASPAGVIAVGGYTFSSQRCFLRRRALGGIPRISTTYIEWFYEPTTPTNFPPAYFILCIKWSPGSNQHLDGLSTAVCGCQVEGSSVEIVFNIQTTGSLVENHSEDIHAVRAGSFEELELNLRHYSKDNSKVTYYKPVVSIQYTDIERDS